MCLTLTFQLSLRGRSRLAPLAYASKTPDIVHVSEVGVGVRRVRVCERIIFLDGWGMKSLRRLVA